MKMKMRKMKKICMILWMTFKINQLKKIFIIIVIIHFKIYSLINNKKNNLNNVFF